MLSVACNTDGRNVYRYERTAPEIAGAWKRILSHTERLEMAHQHDPREDVATPTQQ